MNFTYIFWDNDGVLVDTERYYLQASREALAHIEISLSEEQFMEISLKAGQSIFNLAHDRGFDRSEIESLRVWRDERYSELLRQKAVPPQTGVREALSALHGQIPMAIVTSSQRKHFDIIHSRSGLLPYFDFYLTREDYSCSKPSPEPYLLALEKSRQKSENIVVIEDTPRGLMAAKAAGMTCWVIPGEHTNERDFIAADRILSGVMDIPGLIL